MVIYFVTMFVNNVSLFFYTQLLPINHQRMFLIKTFSCTGCSNRSKVLVNVKTYLSITALINLPIFHEIPMYMLLVVYGFSSSNNLSNCFHHLNNAAYIRRHKCLDKIYGSKCNLVAIYYIYFISQNIQSVRYLQDMFHCFKTSFHQQKCLKFYQLQC